MPTATMNDSEGELDVEDDLDIEERIAAARRRLSPGDCLFCSHHSDGVEDNVSHMSRFHSFFIPDQDILIDLPGLIGYLGEKITIGNLCLFCPNGGREFGSIEAVRKHMIDKAHCKIAYADDEDRAELADFYDFAGDESNGEWEDIDEEDVQAGVSFKHFHPHNRHHPSPPTVYRSSFPPVVCWAIGP